MKKVKAISCDKCESVIISGNTNGLPNGIALILKNGKTITLCQNCVIEFGRMDYKESEKFIKELIEN